MSMCRVFSCVVGRGCLLWPAHCLGKTLLTFALLLSAFQGQICLLLQVFLDFYFCILVPYKEKDIFLGVSSKRSCREQYCIGTWNVRSMNQSKLEVVKQEMARVNVDILGISELKWTAIGEFNSNDIYIYYCRQESLRRIGVAIMVNKRVWNAVLVSNLINHRMISVRFQGKPFNITVIQVYLLTSNAEEAEVEQFYEDLQDLLELTPSPQKRFLQEL